MSVYSGHVVNNMIWLSCIVSGHWQYFLIVNIIKVLGEGGFSFVYLAQDETSGVNNCRKIFSFSWHTPAQRQFALKKIRCPTGSDGVKEALREVEAYRRFKWVFTQLLCIIFNVIVTSDIQISYAYWWASFHNQYQGYLSETLLGLCGRSRSRRWRSNCIPLFTSVQGSSALEFFFVF